MHLSGGCVNSETSRKTFQSILFLKQPGPTAPDSPETPDYFGDLNLDQIVQSVMLNYTGYNLTPFFLQPLTDLKSISYRQEIMKELENQALMSAVKSFSYQLVTMRERLPKQEKQYFRYERERCFLNATSIYCQAITSFSEELSGFGLISEGLKSFRQYLWDYIGSARFRELKADTDALLSSLSEVRYCLHINSGRVSMRPHEAQSDYSATIEAIFEKFRRAAVKDYLARDLRPEGMNHVQAQVLDGVAKLYPEIFRMLESFYQKHAGFLDEVVSRFDREIQFYISYLSHIDKFRRAGHKFCYPRLSKSSKEIEACETFDLALAEKLIADKTDVITNDFFLRGPERIFVVTGPNQGGKTTFARTFGQLHYLAALGCPVPGVDASLFLCNRLFSHFEKEENITTLRGKLQDDLLRIRDILDKAKPDSVIIINEIFSSTTLKDAIFLGKKIMARLTDLDCLGVIVTFLDELSAFNVKTASMVSTVKAENPTMRTFKLERKPADGLGYALSIAEKYHLTHEQLKMRLER